MSWFDHKLFVGDEGRIAEQIFLWASGHGQPPVVEKSKLEHLLKKLGELRNEYNDMRAKEYDDKEMEHLTFRVNQINATMNAVERLIH